MILIILIFLSIYLYTLFNPSIFYRYHETVGNITVYSDEEINKEAITKILISVEDKLKKSPLYKPETKQNIFITNDIFRWIYFTNVNYKVGGLNYVVFNHNVFLRKSDIEKNKLISPSGKFVPGSRTLDYFITHEITHTLVYQELGITKHPLFTNWVIEGYAEYIAHGSESYEKALDTYLNITETSSSKYYTRIRTLVTYLIEKENVSVHDIWSFVDRYEEILHKAIPNDNPMIDDNVSKW